MTDQSVSKRGFDFMRVAGDHREVILQTAANLFARKPFHEVLMDDVADKAGIAKGTVYRYFANKDELFFALSFSYIEMLSAELGTVAAAEKAPVPRLRRMVVRLIELILDNDDFFQVMQRHECELRTRRQGEFLKRRNIFFNHFVNAITEAQTNGEIVCPFDPVYAANMLMGMVRNIIRYCEPRPSPEETAGMVMHVFVNGLKATGTTAAVSSNGAQQ
jgi:AcrR family transcriptional regulator